MGVTFGDSDREDVLVKLKMPARRTGARPGVAAAGTAGYDENSPVKKAAHLRVAHP